jgi:hypothetical protein
MLMWIKLFKYVEVIPQMGVLIKVLDMALGPVLIFACVAMIPVIGLALSYHVAFGQNLKPYSSSFLSLNTLMRMAVDDFDFDEVFKAEPRTALLLFWASAILLVFVLANIFVAIILNSYQTIIEKNPDANDASQFMSMVIVQAKKTTVGTISTKGAHKTMTDHDIKPHVLANDMVPLADTEYWNIFDGYFKVGSATAAELASSRSGGSPSPRSVGSVSPRSNVSPVMFTQAQAQAERVAHAGEMVGGGAAGTQAVERLEAKFETLQ